VKVFFLNEILKSSLFESPGETFSLCTFNSNLIDSTVAGLNPSVNITYICVGSIKGNTVENTFFLSLRSACHCSIAMLQWMARAGNMTNYTVVYQSNQESLCICTLKYWYTTCHICVYLNKKAISYLRGFIFARINFREFCLNSRKF